MLIVIMSLLTLAACKEVIDVPLDSVEDLSVEPFEIPAINRTERGTRIVNGTSATVGQFPHFALLFIKRSTVTVQCGGGLIAVNWVLTANHCVKDAQAIELRFGVTQRDSYEQISMAHSIIRNAIVDISVIKLKTSVRLTSAVKPAQLPRLSEQSQLYVNRMAKVCGMGVDNTRASTISFNLKYAELKVLSQNDCRPYYGIVDPKLMCAKAVDSNASTCPGDSGSPLIVNDGGYTVIVGVVSFGTALGCDIGYPVGYVRTTHQLDWIVYYTGIALRN